MLVAFHFPPCAGSSGLQRTLSYCRHLSSHGWQPIVLTTNPGAYERVSEHQLGDIPGSVTVVRAPSIDIARHFAFRGRYWSRLAVPDRWANWWLTAIPIGLTALRMYKADAIWSTFPIATAHSIASTLVRLSGLPWIADFRDPMVEYIEETHEAFPKDARVRAVRLQLERSVARRAHTAVFCTDSARSIFFERHRSTRLPRLEVIPNGFEEADFRDAKRLLPLPRNGTKRLLLHSGTVYPGADRDPTALLRALATLRSAGKVSSSNFELRLRDPAHVAHFQNLIGRENVADLVTILPALSYREALAEMMSADGLLLLQGVTSNPAVPGKLYEYLRAGQPIIALVHPAGETARALKQAGIDTMAELTEPAPIAALLQRWLANPDLARATLPHADVVAGYSRSELAAKVATLLDQAVSAPNTRE
jgi:glycosyltransferase involved in cell wall biosynthesis